MTSSRMEVESMQVPGEKSLAELRRLGLQRLVDAVHKLEVMTKRTPIPENQLSIYLATIEDNFYTKYTFDHYMRKMDAKTSGMNNICQNLHSLQVTKEMIKTQMSIKRPLAEFIGALLSDDPTQDRPARTVLGDFNFCYESLPNAIRTKDEVQIKRLYIYLIHLKLTETADDMCNRKLQMMTQPGVSVVCDNASNPALVLETISCLVVLKELCHDNTELNPFINYCNLTKIENALKEFPEFLLQKQKVPPVCKQVYMYLRTVHFHEVGNFEAVVSDKCKEWLGLSSSEAFQLLQKDRESFHKKRIERGGWI